MGTSCQSPEELKVIWDSVNIAFRDKDSILDQMYEIVNIFGFFYKKIKIFQGDLKIAMLTLSTVAP